jgi:hypothetical protein
MPCFCLGSSSRSGLIQKVAAGGGRRPAGSARSLQRSAHLATGDGNAPAPAVEASCSWSGVSSRLTFIRPISAAFTLHKIHNFFCLDSVQHCSEKVKKLFFSVDKSEILTASVAKLVSFRWCCAVVRRALSASATPRAPLRCALHVGDLDELSLTSLVPTSH